VSHTEQANKHVGIWWSQFGISRRIGTKLCGHGHDLIFDGVWEGSWVVSIAWLTPLFVAFVFTLHDGVGVLNQGGAHNFIQAVLFNFGVGKNLGQLEQLSDQGDVDLSALNLRGGGHGAMSFVIIFGMMMLGKVCRCQCFSRQRLFL